MGWLESILAGVGIKVPVFITSTLGGFMSLNFFDDVKTKGKRWMIAVSGVAIGVFGASLLVIYLAEEYPLMKETTLAKIEVCVGFFIALFGMSFAAAAVKAIPEWISAAKGFLPKGGSQ